jgi:hypothetical protein
MCLGVLSACRVDAAVALRLRNTADYRLPTFGPHSTKLGHSWFEWIIKSNFSGWFDNSEKGDLSGHFERLPGWSRSCTPPQEYCRLWSTYFWFTWQQTITFLISVKDEKWSGWLVWQFRKRRCVWAFWALAGLIPWLHSTSGMPQTTAYQLVHHMAPNKGIIDFNEKWKVIFLTGLTIKKKMRRVLALWALDGLIPWLHSASGMLQTTANLL